MMHLDSPGLSSAFVVMLRATGSDGQTWRIRVSAGRGNDKCFMQKCNNLTQLGVNCRSRGCESANVTQAWTYLGAEDTTRALDALETVAK